MTKSIKIYAFETGFAMKQHLKNIKKKKKNLNYEEYKSNNLISEQLSFQI